MFRSTTTIRELVLNLAKVILVFMLKHSVKLSRYMLFGDVAACHIAAFSTSSLMMVLDRNM
jgi:hypothetical protein